MYVVDRKVCLVGQPRNDISMSNRLLEKKTVKWQIPKILKVKADMSLLSLDLARLPDGNVFPNVFSSFKTFGLEIIIICVRNKTQQMRQHCQMC